MNNHVRIFLPLTLLLSTMAYTMDKDEQRMVELSDDYPETPTLVAEKVVTKPVPAEVVAEVKKIEKENQVVVSVDSMVLNASAKSNVESVLSTPIPAATLPASEKTEKGMLQRWGQVFHDKVWRGESANVKNELVKNKFDKNNTNDLQRLDRSLEESTKQHTEANLDYQNETLFLCTKNKISVDSKKVVSTVYSFDMDYKTDEEKQLIEGVSSIIQDDTAYRTNAINALLRTFAQTMEDIKKNNEKNKQKIDAKLAQHQIVLQKIVKNVELLRQAHKESEFPINYNVPSESCDVAFLGKQLGLTSQIEAFVALNELMHKNLEKTKGFLEVVDKKEIKTKTKMKENSPATPLEPQPQQ
jgi:hypothetical protein